METGMETREAKAHPRRFRTVAVVVALVVALAGAAAVAGWAALSRTGSGSGSAAPSPSPSPLTKLDLSGLPVTRGPFCDRLGQDAVRAALGGPVTRTAHYGNGDRVELAPGVSDVAHEYGCTFQAASGTRARAWVFAAPVTVAEATALARAARADPNCQEPAAPRFGTPSVATACVSGSPSSTSVTLSGLFGGSWLSCALEQRDTGGIEMVRRTERWCVDVATSMGSKT